MKDELRAEGAMLLEYGLCLRIPTSFKEAERAVILCGSGQGAAIAANKLPGIRACLCHDIYSASQGVEHDDLNVLVMGGRIIGPALATELVKGFLRASFIPEERFVRRLNKVKALEAATDLLTLDGK